jgi:NADPH:quinone reductase
MKAIVVNEFGGPDAFAAVEVDNPTAGRDQVVVRLAVSGLNFLDTNQRRGGTPLKAPYLAGVEGVGTITEVGSAVTGLSVGQRVGWLTGGQGSFADHAVVDSGKAVPIPDDIDDETAAAVLMQGVTAHYLATSTYPVQAGDPVLVHAAAGGVGQLLTQIAKLRGGVVIGTVSTQAKAAAARAAGAGHVLTYDGFADEVRALTDGAGVAVVYDGVGAATFDGSLAALRVRGTLVVYGNSSGQPAPLEIARLVAGGSLFVTRPGVVHYISTPEELRGRTDDLFRWLRSGELSVAVGGRYAVCDVGEAFAALESRQTTGKLLLVHR